MSMNKTLLPVGALVIALSASGLSAEAAQQRGEGRDRGGRQSEGQARERSAGPRDQGNRAPAARADQRDQGNRQPAARPDQRDNRRDQNNYARDNRDYRDRDYNARVPDRRDGYGYGYAVPRVVPRVAPRIVRPSYRHYYGSGGNFSVYFGLGSGYRYGSPYNGRVYGYSVPSAGYGYGARRYYGDVRLLVRPREAAVYVDGYYAGIVDNFDGVFQRLTLEVGPHQIEVEAPGFDSQVFDVYVDASRTVDLRGDLFPERP